MKICKCFTAVLFFFGLFVGYNMKTIQHIKMKYNPPQNQGWGHDSRGAHGYGHQNADIEEEANENGTCGWVLDSDTCDARSDCAWCAAYTDFSHCAEIDHSHDLNKTPIYRCAKTEEKEEKPEKAPVEGDDACGAIWD